MTIKTRKVGIRRPKSVQQWATSWNDIADERVRKVARTLANNDRRRVEIISPTEVIVHNPNWRNSK